MWPSLSSALTWWQWAILAAVPPLLVLLYFLKLKRRPLEVPSTYLWHKSIEDLHVNTIWQRLRRNLLLFLQLLVILLAAGALLRPSVRSRELSGDRFVFLVDNSASMQATDVAPSRLADAKKKTIDLINEMDSGDVAMVVSFSDVARVEQGFTDNRGRLKEAVESIRPTVRPTSLLEALKVASGLANPGQISDAENERDVQVAEALPATLYVLSDGQFGPVSGFSLGNLKPVFVPIGRPEASNVGIVAFNVRRKEARPTETEAFARLEFSPGHLFSLDPSFESDLEGGGVSSALRQPFADRSLPLSDSAKIEMTTPGQQWRIQGGSRTYLVRKSDSGLDVYGAADAKVSAELLLDDRLIDADELAVPAGQTRGVAFDLSGADTGVLQLRITVDAADDLALDNRAWAVVSPPRPIRVLLVTPGNEPLKVGLTTESLRSLAEVAVESPELLKGKPYAEKAAAGAYDLVIYDRCAPEEMPRANTLFVGSLPPQGGWSQKERVDMPQLLPVSTSHPLMQWIDLRDVILAEGWPLDVPKGGSVLMDSDVGPMLAIAPREEFEDVVAGFLLSIYSASDKDGNLISHIGWPPRQSFPVFVFNVFDYLGGGRELVGSGSVAPGKPVVLAAAPGTGGLRVRSPDGSESSLTRDKAGKFDFTDTAQLGPYEVRAGEEAPRWFAVNLFQPAESDIRPDQNPTIKVGYVEVKGERKWETGRRDVWRWILLLGLVVLLVEWYIYNHRVYV